MTTATLDVKISKKWEEAQGICAFELTSENGVALPPFSAGSHIDVHLPGGLIRQYSLCNNPNESNRYHIAVLRDAEGRGGSMAIHDLVHEGDTLRISGPKNHFPLAHDAKNHLLLAGGIGITPILCMAERLSLANETFEMHYCARSPKRAAFVSRILSSDLGRSASFHFSDGEPAQKLDLSTTLKQAPEETHLYVCGPRGFMDAVLTEARKQGWPETRLHYEFFGAVIEQPTNDASFQVKLASSGLTVDVPPGCTVVQALAENGVEVLTSCEQGVCGTCLTRVLEGQPEHRDSYLTDEEKTACDQFLPCCSRSKTQVLILDL
ncbi:PDR/VanB family oxidoreductase [Paraburkholderia metrosideri]|uniref:Phthalate 4,5-dioxygenase oxygenase reductase subunit n=1 Tax=Paraburkholderia metrosideri TaxID=580937 RepID=A0ABM8NTV4_9BURK|nr:PDR/VanB family oxidoreductase [Paraburkholderia metrosideri]CAD6543142.1 Phthalate 4,5-dioxygenase oxygenase reductase subunit [Paraburkholderia metrosideri]